MKPLLSSSATFSLCFLVVSVVLSPAPMSRCCSQCGHNGHNSRTCSGVLAPGGEDEGIMLFGVRLMRKSASLGSLVQYERRHEASNAGAGYVSADDAAPHASGSRERKRGIPWTEDEHKLFLVGLQKVGKGDWRGISKNFVKTRTPTQVASHAQKYFMRRNNLNRRRRRSSLFDITTESITGVPMKEEQVVNQQHNTSQPQQSHNTFPVPETGNSSGYPAVPASAMPMHPVPVPVLIQNPMENLTLGQIDSNNTRLVRPIPVLPLPPDATDLNLGPSSLSLKLCLSSTSQDHPNQPSRHSAFRDMPSFKNGDGIITVA